MQGGFLRDQDGALVLSAGSGGTPASIGAVAKMARGRVPKPEFQIPVAYLHGEDPTELIKSALRRGYTFVTVKQLADAIYGRGEIPNRFALLIYDDGHLSQFETLFPICQSFGVPATIGIVPNFLDGGTISTALHDYVPVGGYPVNTPMTWANLATMIAAGWDVQNHTLKHNDLATQDNSAARLADFPVANARIAAMTGLTPTCVIYPYGSYDGTVVADLRTLGYELGFTTQGFTGSPVFSYPGEGRFMVNRGGVYTRAWLDGCFDDIFYSWVNDVTGGVNAANALGWWTLPAGATLIESGQTVQVVGANLVAFSTDWFAVRGGDTLYYRMDTASTGQSAGNADIAVQQYTGPASARVGGTKSVIKTYAASGAYARQEGTIVLDAATTWVRLIVETLASYNGTLTMRRGLLRRNLLPGG